MQHYLSNSAEFDIHSHFAQSSEQAFRLFNQHTFDICFLDYYLQGETGLDILEKMHELSIDTPVIMVTGLDEDESMSLFSDRGANGADRISAVLNKETLSSQSIGQCLQSIFKA